MGLESLTDWEGLQKMLENMTKNIKCNYCNKPVGFRFQGTYNEKTGIETYYHSECLIKYQEENK